MKTAKEYYLMGMNTIAEAKQQPVKPRLLMHSCCGPCNAFPIELLAPVFELTLYFNNSNIYPNEEYVRRLDELKRYVAHYNEANNDDVTILVTEYDNVSFTKFLSPRAADKEGQERCFMCYEKRMHEAYSYANEQKFDYFTTVMTISRQKDSMKLNQIGEQLQTHFPNTKYLFSNFKKNKGMDRGVELSKLFDMYKQDYCGCIYSYQSRKQKMTNETKL